MNRPPQQQHPHHRPPSDDDDDSDDELRRPGSSGSDASSNVTRLSATPITPIDRPPGAGYFSPNPRSNSATSSPQHQHTARPMPDSSRRPSGRGPSIELQRHRSRHHSQGFFEPSLPTASSEQMPPQVSASRIAAQAAMHQQMLQQQQLQVSQQQSRRPQHPVSPMEDSGSRRSVSASPPLVPLPLRINQPTPSLPPPTAGNVATTAANVVFPRAGSQPPRTSTRETKEKEALFQTKTYRH
ncbi:hypothetical protein N7533_008425 [Penicillium manginii]|uniref:uncharacterized protein n=1 Tax=Penicillium manginii TaxID=203109 RepID=UPI002549781A|nr:uncharacterized protein N7533_008425 [Penicillium manginii]KAJ5743555.1 hypothetical protein N7533_008425 [Penicillium manginii]